MKTRPDMTQCCQCSTTAEYMVHVTRAYCTKHYGDGKDLIEADLRHLRAEVRRLRRALVLLRDNAPNDGVRDVAAAALAPKRKRRAK